MQHCTLVPEVQVPGVLAPPAKAQAEGVWHDPETPATEQAAPTPDEPQMVAASKYQLWSSVMLQAEPVPEICFMTGVHQPPKGL